MHHFTSPVSKLSILLACIYLPFILLPKSCLLSPKRILTIKAVWLRVQKPIFITQFYLFHVFCPALTAKVLPGYCEEAGRRKERRLLAALAAQLLATPTQQLLSSAQLSPSSSAQLPLAPAQQHQATASLRDQVAALDCGLDRLLLPDLQELAGSGGGGKERLEEEAWRGFREVDSYRSSFLYST